MAGGPANYENLKILDGMLGGPQLALPATVYAAAVTSADTKAQRDAGTFTEPSGNAYARVAVTNNATNFPAASGNSKSNGTAITFPSPSPLGWGDILAIYLMDASSAGNPLAWADLVGTEKEVTAVVSGNVFTCPAHGFVQHDRVKLTVPVSGSLPGGYTDGAYYYVLSGVTTDTFTLSATDGGTVITVTSAGAALVGKDQRVTTNPNVPPQIGIGQLTFTLASS